MLRCFVPLFFSSINSFTAETPVFDLSLLLLLFFTSVVVVVVVVAAFAVVTFMPFVLDAAADTLGAAADVLDDDGMSIPSTFRLTQHTRR